VRAHDLHSLRWELLTDPETGVYLALDERIRFVRTLDSANLTPIIGALRDELRALIVVSNPTNLGQFHLAEVDVDGEISRARKALGTIPTTVLGDDPDAAGRATLVNLAAQLRSAPQIVFLIAHGTVVGGVPYLWLENETGAADKVPGSTLVAMLSRLVRRPLLFTLLSCRSAGNGYGETLSALGPQLSAIGFPAVIAFQGDVAMSTVKGILPPLITELQRDGQIDRALAAARGALGLTQPWWQAVLWIQSEGALWQEQSHTDDQSNGDTLLEAIIQPHHDVIGTKIARFVGRESELIHIEKQIATLQPEGGYLLVQGRAGEGKSSILAMLILRDLIARSQVSVPQEWNNQTFRQFALSVGRDKLFYHFIPSDPGRDYQISLLRDINAQLALQYRLPSFYADSSSLPALKNFFYCSFE
ncbi:MAG: CHAT domain-containing protein, partial [Blastochloris sp.]|nr:CHAT domain-containing protein [Blastochloris sp.]